MLERMKEIVTAGGLTFLAVMLFVLLAAYCWQCLPRETLRRKRIWELAFLAAFVGCFWHLGATKSTNRTDSAGAPFGALLMSGSPMGTDAPVDATPIPDAGLRISEFEVLPNGMRVVAEWDPAAGLPGGAFDLFGSLSLTDGWGFLGDVAVPTAATSTTVFVATSDLPGAPTNMPSAAFLTVGAHVDADGDGLYDGRERWQLGTDPLRWDTDGDGVADGGEVAVGTNPLARDTDADGYDDDEEGLAGTDPLVADAGSGSTVRYFYDDDDRLVGSYAGSSGCAACAALSAAGNPLVLQTR